MDTLNKELLSAAKDGKEEKVLECLERGANVNCKDDSGKTPLHCAALWGYERIVVILVEKGAEIDAKDGRGKTPLRNAVSWGHDGIVTILLEKGVEINTKDDKGMTPLHWAVWKGGKDKIVEILVSKGGDVNAKDREGLTPLHLATMAGDNRSVTILLEKGAEINVKDIGGKTPLHKAAYRGHDSIVMILLKKGAEINTKDAEGVTPLHWAAGGGHDKSVDILVEKGAEIYAKDNYGETPLDQADKKLKKTMMDIAFRIKDTKGWNVPKMDDIDEFGELMSKGTYASFNNIAYLGGACNVGKTTLASILTGEDIPKNWDSTDGLNIFFGRFGIDLETKEMVPLSEVSGNQEIFTNLLVGQPSMNPSTSEEDTLLCNKQQTEKTKISPVSSDRTGNMSDIALKTAHIYFSQKKKAALSSVKEVSIEHLPDSNTRHLLRNPKLLELPAKSVASIRDEIKEELKKGTYKVKIAPSDLVDFGGQRSFDMTHQLFIRQKGVFVLMLDGSKNLFDVLEEYPQGRVTTASILLHWVNSILTYCGEGDDDILPLIIFVATHSDSFPEKVQLERRKRELTDGITKLFDKHENRQRIKYESLYFINGQDKNDIEIEMLKSKLVEVAFKQESWGQKMPMAWVPLELQISEMRTNGINFISKEDLSHLNKTNNELALSEKQIEHFLKSQHSLGRIMYFDLLGLQSFIIIQPRALVNILRSVITDQRFWPNDHALNKILSDLTKSGRIVKRDLFRLWSQKEFNPYFPTKEIKEFIAKVLVQLDILVQPKRYETIQPPMNDFLVPCIVNRQVQHEPFDYAIKNGKTICLSYQLAKSDIPSAFSYKLIGALLNIWPVKETQQGACLFHKTAFLSIDTNNELYVSIEENRVIIHLTHSISRYMISPNIASIVQEYVSVTLEKILQYYQAAFGKVNKLDRLDLFDVLVGEMGHGSTCLIPLSEAQNVDEWECEQNETHKTKTCLYWIHEKTQIECSHECNGIDTECLKLVPEDKHLIRLAEKIGKRHFDQFIRYLGLKEVQWEDIEENTNYGDRLTQRFVGLCKWKKNKLARNMSPTFLDLSKALKNIDYSQHFLCEVFREEFTEVFDLDNPRLLEIPDDKVLKELSDKHIGPHALPLGIELGLDMNSIDATIVKYSKDMLSQNYDILKKWKYSSETSQVRPTVRTLMLALQHVDARGFQFLTEKFDGKPTEESF